MPSIPATKRPIPWAIYLEPLRRQVKRPVRQDVSHQRDTLSTSTSRFERVTPKYADALDDYGLNPRKVQTPVKSIEEHCLYHAAQLY